MSERRSGKRRHSLLEPFELDGILPPKRGEMSLCLPSNPSHIFSESLPKDVAIFQNALKEVIACDIRSVARDRCAGCAIDHPSQTQHFHLMADSQDLVGLYFEEVFANLLTGKEGGAKERVWHIMENSVEEGEKELQRMKYLEKDTFLSLSASLRDKIKEDLLSSDSW